ncbi:MAG: lytic murein transglycosylase [Alphaproteobacteria bacterium]|nr:lytic murein transglycosylase [Alphaproteobacteria bacterium]
MNRNLLRSILVVAAVLLPTEAFTEPDAKFREWLEGVRVEARAKGISGPILERSLSGVEPIPRIIELDRSQPESTITFTQYINRIVNSTRVKIGREKLKEHRDILEQVRQKFSVQPRFIVALWGIETNFGQFTGGFPVINALATLAYDGRRSDYFRGELMKAFQILEEGHISPEDMKGSWAGAMGQSQFMPSSFLAYAHDYDGDGAKDIWNTQADVFASAANYLKGVGWDDDLTWGREVQLPPDFDTPQASLEVIKSIREWQQMGVRRTDGADLPARDIQASIILPGGAGQPAFMIYGNYRATLRWNYSHYFATAVGLLSDRIAYQ